MQPFTGRVFHSPVLLIDLTLQAAQIWAFPSLLVLLLLLLSHSYSY